MTADLVDWQDEYVLDHRRRLKTAAFVSLAVHACVLGLFAVTPPRPVAPIPEAISVDLIAAPVPARSAARPAPAPEPAAPPPPAPVAPPAPAPSVAPPPPIAEAPVQVLPEETPGRIREAKPKPPKVVAEAKPEPKPAPVPPPRRVEEPAYEDDEAAMAALMEELGADESLQAVQDSAQARADRDAALAEAAESAGKATGKATGKAQLSPEQVAWDRAVIQKISKNFPMPKRARGSGLVAQVEIQVAASGAIAGKPKLVGTSGDLSFDGWALSAIGQASPLPPPPVAGVRRLNMRSEEY